VKEKIQGKVFHLKEKIEEDPFDENLHDKTNEKPVDKSDIIPIVVGP